MTDRVFLYGLFGVSPTCSDDELRRAYRRAMMVHHPDLNPHQIEAATAKTQQLVSAFAELTDLRKGKVIIVEGYEFTIRWVPDFLVDIKDIASRKAALRNEWERFQQDPSDPVSALRLVHAAFRAGRQDSFMSLLLNPILVDSAPLLLSLAEKDDACETLLRWSEVLWQAHELREAIQILEDALATEMVLSSVSGRLCILHYYFATYVDPNTRSKAAPQIRIEHICRARELGYPHDFVINKVMAEAYHDLGDDEQAREFLRKALGLNPALTGVVRLSRALGFSQSSNLTPPKTESPHKYRYIRHEQIPSAVEVHEWTQRGDWDVLFDFANPQNYSPRLLPAAREIFRRIAISLGASEGSRAIEALFAMLDLHYWDVREAAITSLSRIGDRRTLDRLERFQPQNTRESATLHGCISYLKARITDRDSATVEAAPRALLTQAQNAFASENYGHTRILLEKLLASVEPSDSTYIDATILLARSCAKVSDFGTAVELIKPILPRLPAESRSAISENVTSWLWNTLCGPGYAPLLDDNYRLALDIHLEIALSARTPDDVLKSLHRLTRWLEILGVRGLAQWIRQLIRTEAPGTWYVDRDDRERYFRTAELSLAMTDYLAAFEGRVMTYAPARVREVLGSTHALEAAQLT